MNFESLAKKLTSRSNHKQHHHAAVLTLGGAIVAVGYNRGREHAEMMAKRLYRQDLTPRHKLYSFRWAKSGKWANAKPCEKCAKALGRVKVFYTNADGGLQRD